MKCSFCEDEHLKERTIVENDLAFALPTRTPIVPGHVLVLPKRCIKYYEDLTQEEKTAIEDLRHKIKQAIIKCVHAEGFNYAWNEEELGGQSVPHFHLHIVPRKAGDAGIYEYEPREFLYRPGARTTITPIEELSDVAELIKKAL